MSEPAKRRRISVSERLYQIVLLVYPAAHRREYGPLMQQAFRDLYQDARQQDGLWGVIRLWQRVLIDISTTVLDEHLDAYQEGTFMKKLIIEEAIRAMALVGIVMFGVLPVTYFLFDLDPTVVLRYALPIPFLLFPILVVVRNRTGYKLHITMRRQWYILCGVLFLLGAGLELLFAARGVVSWSKAGTQTALSALVIAAMVLFGPRLMPWGEKQ